MLLKQFENPPNLFDRGVDKIQMEFFHIHQYIKLAEIVQMLYK